MAAGAQREGSQFGFVPVNGVFWRPKGDGFEARFPGGSEAQRIHRMLQARLPFGRNLLVHDSDPNQQLAVGFEPGDAVTFTQQGEVLVVTVPPGHALLQVFGEAAAEEIVRDLGC